MAPISRRAFIKRTLSAGAVLYLYANGGYRIVTAASGPEAFRLRIVHTNDHHAHIDPVEVTIQSTPTSVTRNFGGVARRKTIFDQIRTDVAAAADPLDKNILFLDAGDVFQGTLYFNLYKGQADLEFYNALGYDVTAVGNHEFDSGDQTFVDYLSKATFPIIAANITSGSGPLQPLISTAINTPPGQLGPAIIKTVGTEQVGIFGITTQETKVSSSPGKDTQFLDPIATATAQVAALKAAGATKIIALTHIGYALDQELAAKVSGIDIIVGGHSHTPLEPTAGLGPVGIATAGPYPTVVTNTATGKEVPIVTDWEWAKWVGDVTVSFNAAGEVITATGAPRPVWADGIKGGRALLTGEQPEITPDATFQNIIDTKYKPGVDALGKTKIGSTTVLLDGGSGVYRTRETNGGDLIADALRDKALNLALGQAGIPVIAITNSGGVRAPINVGDITTGDVLTVLPFGNTIASVDLTGAQVIAALENGVSQVEATAGRFPQVSGLKFSWTRAGTPAVQASPAVGATPAIPGVKGSRILANTVQVFDEATKKYVPIDLAKTYRVITNNFMLSGGDGYNVFTKGGDLADPTVKGGTNQLDTGLIMADIVEEYISAHSPIVIATTGRILESVVRVRLPLVFGTPAAVTR